MLSAAELEYLEQGGPLELQAAALLTVLCKSIKRQMAEAGVSKDEGKSEHPYTAAKSLTGEFSRLTAKAIVVYWKEAQLKYRRTGSKCST